jgi:hypothetical protein
MSKSANAGIAAFRVAAEKKYPEFMELMEKLSFKKVEPGSVIDFLVEGKKKLPEKRVNSENFKQLSFEYISKTRMKVILHTGVIYTEENGVEFSDKGAGWVHIFNDTGKKSKPVMSWLFNRNLGSDLLFRIGAYAKLAKNIVDSRPGSSTLSQDSETSFSWRGNGVFKTINTNAFLFGLDKKETAYVKRRQRVSNKYLLKTEPLVNSGEMERRRDVRKRKGYKDKL